MMVILKVHREMFLLQKTALANTFKSLNVVMLGLTKAVKTLS